MRDKIIIEVFEAIRAEATCCHDINQWFIC